jgi:pimeloyl-ACP methyl ester carboxylesterase
MRIAVLTAALGLVAVFILGAIGPAGADVVYPEPSEPATAIFPADFPKLVDHQWGFPLGGFGGIRAGAPLKHVPVIFVHGNNVDADDFYVVRDDFRTAGWTDQELWAPSYNGKGGANGTAATRAQPERDTDHVSNAGLGALTDNAMNLPDVYDFIQAVRQYTGSAKFAIVAHSLGVTITRKVLKDHPELRTDLVAFVGIAGANHGTTFCPPGSEGQLASCDEIAAGTPWLAGLNGPDGGDETYAPARWLTIYDGSGEGDPAFAGPDYAGSPQLRGADNRTYPHTYHNDLRISPPIVATYRQFLEAAERATPNHGGTRAGAVAAARPALPVTGGTPMPLALAPVLGAIALGIRGLLPRERRV